MSSNSELTANGETNLAPADIKRSTGVSANDQKLTYPVAFGWAIGSFGMLALLGVVNALFLNYVVDHLFMSAAVAGLIVTVTRLFDALMDPFMGSLSDQTRSRWGRRRPYLLLGGVLCTISPIILFSDPFAVAGVHPEFYVILALSFFAIAHTVFNVPYLAMSYELTANPKERTWLISLRVYAISIGGIAAQALAPWIVTSGGGGQQGFANMGWAMAVIVAVPSLIAFLMTKNARAVPVPISQKRPKLRDMGKAFGNKPFRQLILAKSCYMLGTGIQTSAISFFLTKVLNEPLSMLGLVASFLLTSVIVSQPAWVWICNRIGKRKAFLIAAPLNALVNLSWLLIEPGAADWEYAVRAMFVGLSAGGMVLTVQAMLPDTLQHEAERSDIPQQGVLSGVFTTVERGVSAASVAVTGFMLSIGGYVAGADHQSELAIQTLYICVGVMPMLGMVLGMWAIRAYTLKG